VKKFLFFLIILLIAAWFIAVNALTKTDIVLFIPVDGMTLKNIPLSYSLLAAFLLGVVVTLAFSLFRGRKKPPARPAPDFQNGVTPEAAPKSEDTK
jgi:TRAP-type C4-dicarboxylate transport system permease small subunit